MNIDFGITSGGLAWITVIPVVLAGLGFFAVLSGFIALLGSFYGVWIWQNRPDLMKYSVDLAPIVAAFAWAFYSTWNEKRLKRLSFKQQTALKSELDNVREQGSKIKENLTSLEQEEEQSLQIYGLAKGLAESIVWGPMAQRAMAPKIVEAVSQVFGTRDMLLHALSEDGNFAVKLSQGDISDAPPLPAAPVREPFIKQVNTNKGRYLAVPVWLNNELLGYLNVRLGRTAMSESSILALGEDISEPLAIGLKKAMLFAQVETLSRIDGLTGVLRRQSFMESMQQELARAYLFRYGFSLLMLDIDYFKRINDTYGHAAGDAVLSRLGQLLKESVYETDVVGRYGGEEFLILFPRADTTGVGRKAEALRRRVESEQFVAGTDIIKVTVSMGISHYPQHGSTIPELLNSADTALYLAKTRGRNQIAES